MPSWTVEFGSMECTGTTFFATGIGVSPSRDWDLFMGPGLYALAWVHIFIRGPCLPMAYDAFTRAKWIMKKLYEVFLGFSEPKSSQNMDEEYDCIVLGTGLTECILSGRF